MFSGFRTRMVILLMMLDVTGSRKFKMAAGKPEILIVWLLDEMETRYQRLDPGFGARVLRCAISDIVRCNRESEIQDGGQ